MITLLHIEDNDDDAFLLAEACRREGIPHRLQRAINGAEGLKYLLGEGSYSDRAAHPLPDLIITDLHMPVLDGLEFLRSINSQASIPPICKIVLTSSQNEQEIQTAYSLGASACFSKLSTLMELRVVVNQAYDIYRRFVQSNPVPSSLPAALEEGAMPPL